jgi:hypothetical protein
MLDFRFILVMLMFISLASMLCGAFSAKYVDADQQSLWTPIFGPHGTVSVTETGEYISIGEAASFWDKLQNTLTWSYPILQQDAVGETVRYAVLIVLGIVTALMAVSFVRSLLPF